MLKFANSAQLQFLQSRKMGENLWRGGMFGAEIFYSSVNFIGAQKPPHGQVGARVEGTAAETAILEWVPK